MQIEDVLRAQRNQAMDALAQLDVIVAGLRKRVADLEASAPQPAAPTIEMIPRQAAKIADGL